MNFLFKSILGIFALLLATITGYCQSLTGLSTQWDDSFTQWYIYTGEEELYGDIVMRWAMREDWSEWDYRIGEYSGFIQVKWKDDPNWWEVRGNGQVITIRTIFKDDFRRWQVSNGEFTVDVESTYSNRYEEWTARTGDRGYFGIYTAYEGDLRDWIIVDEAYEEVPLEMRLAIAFIPIIFTVPKF